MPVYRCNSCGCIAETLHHAAGGKIACEGCSEVVTLFDTAFYVRKLVERHFVMRRELDLLKQQAAEQPEITAQVSKADPPLKDDVYDTASLATEIQHEPLRKWFAAKQASPVFEFSAVDTTGFFDEAALAIGNQYALLSGVVEQVRYGYRREWSWLNFDMGSKVPDEARQISDALRELYSQSFFSRFTFNKQKNVIGVGLQPAMPVRQFFDGGWLEWWTFLHLLEISIDRGLTFSCARNAVLQFQNGEKRELDVAFLLRERFPIFVECKTGEFRAEIDKYVALRRRLGIDRSQFLICNPDLSDEQATAFTAMYDLTFVNLNSYRGHLNLLIS